MADFGQNRLWPKPTLAKADFGQNRLWPNRLWPKPTLAKPTLAKTSLICCVLCCVVLCVVCVAWVLFHGVRVGFHVWVLVSRFGLDRPSPGPPFPWTALPGPSKISLFFPLSRRKIRSFLPSLGVFSLNFGGVFEGRDPQMCTFGLSGCRVEPRRPHQTGPPGLAHDSENSKTHPPHTQTTTTNKHHQQAPPTGTNNRHQQQAPTTGTNNRHQQQAPTGTNRHRQAPTGTDRHRQIVELIQFLSRASRSGRQAQCLKDGLMFETLTCKNLW